MGPGAGWNGGVRGGCRLALAVGLLLVPGFASARDDAAELERLRQAIQARRERVAAYERQEADLFAALRALDDSAREAAAQVVRAQREARAATAQLREVEGALADAQARVSATRRALGRRAVALYKAGELGPVRLIFAAGSLRDRLARIQALQLLLDHDRALLDRLARQRAALEQARAEAVRAAALRDEALRRLTRRRDAFQGERAAKRALLADVRRDRSRERAALRELEEAARALEEKLAQLQRGPGSALPGLAGLQGRLAPPVSGRVLRGFGRVVDTEYRTQTFRKGVDFAVQRGEPVRAVAAGEVRFAGWFRGYGRMVIVDHGESWFTVSGHLDELSVRVGDEVRAGQSLGSAGETGSLSGPRLYFEIRHGSQALDPSRWLRLAPVRQSLE